MTLFEPILLLLWGAVNIAVFLGIFRILIFFFDNWCRKKYDWRNRNKR